MLRNKNAATSLALAIALWTVPPYLLYRKGWEDSKHIALLLSILATVSSTQAYSLNAKQQRSDDTLDDTPYDARPQLLEADDTLDAKADDTLDAKSEVALDDKKAKGRAKKRINPNKADVSSNIDKGVVPSIVVKKPDARLNIKDDYQREGLKIIGDMAWLKALLLSKPILLVGGMGAGKTTFTNYLLYARMLFFSHKIYVCDPHTTTWPKGAIVYGQPKKGESISNWDEVNQGLAEYYAFTLTTTHPLTFVFDEVTIYEGNADKKLMGSLLSHALSFTRKYDMWPILISHNDTIATLGGGKGGYSKMMAGMVTVHLYPERDELGILKPSGKGTVKNLLSDGKGRYIDTDFDMPSQLNQLKSLVLARDKQTA